MFQLTPPDKTEDLFFAQNALIGRCLLWMPETAWGGRREGAYPSVGEGRPGWGVSGEAAQTGVGEGKQLALGGALHHTLIPHTTAQLDFHLVSPTVFNVRTRSRNFPK